MAASRQQQGNQPQIDLGEFKKSPITCIVGIEGPQDEIMAYATFFELLALNKTNKKFRDATKFRIQQLIPKFIRYKIANPHELKLITDYYFHHFEEFKQEAAEFKSFASDHWVKANTIPIGQYSASLRSRIFSSGPEEYKSAAILNELNEQLKIILQTESSLNDSRCLPEVFDLKLTGKSASGCDYIPRIFSNTQCCSMQPKVTCDTEGAWNSNNCAASSANCCIGLAKSSLCIQIEYVESFIIALIGIHTGSTAILLIAPLLTLLATLTWLQQLHNIDKVADKLLSLKITQLVMQYQSTLESARRKIPVVFREKYQELKNAADAKLPDITAFDKNDPDNTYFIRLDLVGLFARGAMSTAKPRTPTVSRADDDSDQAQLIPRPDAKLTGPGWRS